MPCGNAITAPFVIGEDVACTSSMITAVCVWSVKTLLHTLHKASHALPYGMSEVLSQIVLQVVSQILSQVVSHQI